MALLCRVVRVRYTRVAATGGLLSSSAVASVAARSMHHAIMCVRA